MMDINITREVLEGLGYVTKPPYGKGERWRLYGPDGKRFVCRCTTEKATWEAAAYDLYLNLTTLFRMVVEPMRERGLEPEISSRKKLWGVCFCKGAGSFAIHEHKDLPTAILTAAHEALKGAKDA